MNEKAFLAAYNPKDYPPVLVMVDAALFTFHEEQLLALLVKRSNHPELGNGVSLADSSILAGTSRSRTLSTASSLKRPASHRPTSSNSSRLAMTSGTSGVGR